MAATYIHVCYQIVDSEKTADFYVNKLGMQKVREMHFSDATTCFFAMARDPSSPMLELTHNHGQTEPYAMGNGREELHDGPANCRRGAGAALAAGRRMDPRGRAA
jgi:catechol 2,3-dioxygenase-like lactoylglutathione lyase family enzyme